MKILGTIIRIIKFLLLPKIYQDNHNNYSGQMYRTHKSRRLYLYTLVIKTGASNGVVVTITCHVKHTPQGLSH